jgi:hypothetical protein
MLRHHRLTTILITTLLISQATGASGQQLGKGGGAASGSAGPGGAQGENAQLEKCDSPRMNPKVKQYPNYAVLV